MKEIECFYIHIYIYISSKNLYCYDIFFISFGRPSAILEWLANLLQHNKTSEIFKRFKKNILI